MFAGLGKSAATRAALVIGTLGTLGALAGCNRAGPTQVACTAVFVMQTVVVRNASGALVSDATITATVMRTGKQLVPSTLALLAPGNYVIVDDGHVSDIRQQGDDIRVTGTSPGGGFSADYVFNVPQGCHINKVSGPDTVTVN